VWVKCRVSECYRCFCKYSYRCAVRDKYICWLRNYYWGWLRHVAADLLKYRLYVALCENFGFLYFTLLHFTIWISLIVKYSSCLVLSCPVLIVALWRALWYAVCRVILLYLCDPRSDVCAVVFCSSHRTHVTPTLIYALPCSVLIIPMRPSLWCTLCCMCGPHFDIRSVVFYFDHTRATLSLMYSLSCSVLIIAVRPSLWCTLCCVLFWLYPCDPHFDIRSVVFCFDHTCVTPLWYTLCRVLFWS
jgi:hypothetical protein